MEGSETFFSLSTDLQKTEIKLNFYTENEVPTGRVWGEKGGQFPLPANHYVYDFYREIATMYQLNGKTFIPIQARY